MHTDYYLLLFLMYLFIQSIFSIFWDGDGGGGGGGGGGDYGSDTASSPGSERAFCRL